MEMCSAYKKKISLIKEINMVHVIVFVKLHEVPEIIDLER